MAYAERRNGRTTGRWVVNAEHKESHTRWHQAFAGITKQQAEGNEAYFRATGQKPPHMLSAPSCTFSECAERFKERNIDWLNAHDGRTNAQRLQFAIDRLGPLDIQAVRGQVLDDFVDAVRKRAGHNGPPAHRTVNRYLDAVSKVLKYAHRREWIAGMPHMPRESNTGAERSPLSWDTENAICAALSPASAFLVRVLAGTGLRLGELYSLHGEQITDTGIQLEARQTKTRHPRAVPIPMSAARWLRVLLASGQCPTAAQLYKQFKVAAEKCGDGKSYTLHSLRHTTVTRLNESGANPLDVAKIVGHRLGTVTEKYYHPSLEHLAKVAEKVQLMLGETHILDDYPNNLPIVKQWGKHQAKLATVAETE